MAGVTWPEERTEELKALIYKEHLTDHEAAARMGLTYNQIREKRRTEGWPGGSSLRGQPSVEAPLSSESLEDEGDGDERVLRSSSARITTPDELLRKAKVDTEVWEVYWQRVKQYEGYLKNNDGEPVVVPMFAVEVKIRRNRKACVVKEIGARILADIAAARPAWQPVAPAVAPRLKDRFLWEACFMDLHVGKLAWGPESGEDYDSEIAEGRFGEALEDLIQQVSGRHVEQILFPIGNDLLQIDNLTNSTTSGTPQDTDTRFAKIFVRAEAMMRYALERLSGIAPVVAPIVPGNHDRQSAFTLGRVLHAWFHGNERVKVDISPALRKYHRYGVNLIGYTHGSEEKPADLPLIMAQERPLDWSETLFREWHVGHLHKAKETRYTAGDNFNGVRVRIIPTLCSADAWHYMRGYVGGIRSAEAYLWNNRTGYAGHQASNVLPEAA